MSDLEENLENVGIKDDLSVVLLKIDARRRQSAYGSTLVLTQILPHKQRFLLSLAALKKTI